MKNDKLVNGFSKKSKSDKIKWCETNFGQAGANVEETMTSFWLADEDTQATFDGFSENTISNFILPYGIAPNFIIDHKTYAVPMVIEESSVVAAASAAAKYWSTRGGFNTTIVNILKEGHVSFLWHGQENLLQSRQHILIQHLKTSVKHLTERMEARGGGIQSVELISFSEEMAGLYQIKAQFDTCDSMGANFINSILENFGQEIEAFFEVDAILSHGPRPDIVMCILSNYTPECLVRSMVSCPVPELGTFCNGNMSAEEFARKFETAVNIARIDPYRATTHNKGIYNGIDAVVIATGNDFRAIEAAGHAFAAKDGTYRSLSRCTVVDDTFSFELEVPLAIGTVGGLTSLHPLAKQSLQLLGSPSAKELMSIIASVGLAQNFAAVRSLTTTGIQLGHMKMHLMNILLQLNASTLQTKMAQEYFKDKPISFSGVRAFVEGLDVT